MKVRNIEKSCLIVALIAALGFQAVLPVQAGNFVNSPGNLLLEPEVWVDDNYTSGGFNDGHIWGQTAFATIQSGLDAVTLGGTVYVAPGLYPEEVKISSQVHLIGDPGDATPGPGPDAPTIGGCPVGITYCSGIEFLAPANGTTIEGFIVRDHDRNIGVNEIGGFGIFSKNQFNVPVTDITINDNLFIDNRWEAIMFFSDGSLPSLYFDNVKALNNRVENTAESTTAWVGIECTNCRNSLIQGNIIEGKVEKGIWIASEGTGTNVNFTNGMGVVVTGNTVNGAVTAAIEVESFDTNGGSAAPFLTGVTISGNTLNRTSAIVGTQSDHLIFIHRDHFSLTDPSKITDITISNNQMDHSYGAFSAIYATVADQLTITGNAITTTAHLWQHGAAILLYNNGGDNLISENHINILNIGTTSTAGIALAYTSAVPGNSENFIISRNTITSASPMGSAGIHLTPGFSGASTKSVTISENRIIGFYNSLRFENTTDSHTLTVQGNSFSGNPGGVSSTLSAPLTLENNWWGCNAGPAQPGCDTITGLVDANPWLVLTFAPDVNRVAPGASQVLTANLLFNSNGQDVSALNLDVVSTTASLTASLGSFNPTSAPLSVGVASTLYTAPANPGIANICSQVDNQQVCKSLFIAGDVLFLPSIIR